MNRNWPSQLAGIAFVFVVVAAIAAMLAGFGVPVGVGALAGFILGGIAGLYGALWVGRGGGRSSHFTSWSSSGSGAGMAQDEMTQLRERTELASVDLGSVRAVVPVLATLEAGGLGVQLVAAEIHDGGIKLEVDVRTSPGSLQPGFLADVVVTDDAGTNYRASGQSSGGGLNPARYMVAVIPPPPPSARQLEVRIERFLDPFPGGTGRAAAGPWTFQLSLPELT